MPWYSGVRSDCSCTRVLARSMVATRPSASAGSAARNASMAISDATSPAWAPPIPSASTNSGACTNKLSSLPVRWRPTSEPCHFSLTRST